MRKRNAKSKAAAPTWNVNGPPIRAFSVGDDGSRRRILGRKIVVDVGGGVEVELALFVPDPRCAGTLCIASRGVLVAHVGAANVIYLSVDKFGAIKDSPFG